MFQEQLISKVVEWERRLEIEEAQRKSRRFEDVFTYSSSASQPVRKERVSIFERFFSRRKENSPAYSCCTQQTYRDTQAS